ncbi:MAG: response regulator [Planctomycetes bacterium]|nr:response regulator [Planctomycetota bacterium]
MPDAKPKILLVDDDPGIRRMLGDYLSDSYTVLAASNAAEAARLWTLDLALMIVDISMPGASGLDLVEALRKRSSNVPVLIVTAYASPEHVRRARALHVQHFLVKPFDLAVIEQRVREAIFGAPATPAAGAEDGKPAAVPGADRLLTEGTIEVDFRTLCDMAREIPVPVNDGLLASAASYVLLDASFRPERISSIEPRDVVAREGEPLSLGGIRRLETHLASPQGRVLFRCRLGNAGVADLSRPSNLLLARSVALARYLADKIRSNPQAIPQILGTNPVLREAQRRLDRRQTEVVEQVFARLFDVAEVPLVLTDLANRGGSDPKAGRLRDVAVGMAGLAAAILVRLLVDSGRGLRAEELARVAFPVGLGAFLADLALANHLSEWEDPDISLPVWKRHPEEEEAVLARAGLPEDVREIVRRHHEEPRDLPLLVRVVHIADAYAQLVTPYGVLASGDWVQESPQPLSPDRALERLADLSLSRGLYDEECLLALGATLGNPLLAEKRYELEVRQLRRACPALLLVPQGERWAAGLCGDPAFYRKLNAERQVCGGRSAAPEDQHQGKAYHRCLAHDRRLQEINQIHKR